MSTKPLKLALAAAAAIGFSTISIGQAAAANPFGTQQGSLTIHSARSNGYLSLPVRGYGYTHRFGYGHGGHRGHYDWHDTSHYDWHPGYMQRHGNHYHYVPGHYDFHHDGHYDYHRGGHGRHYWH
jgi:hypothetical protein